MLVEFLTGLHQLHTQVPFTHTTMSQVEPASARGFLGFQPFGSSQKTESEFAEILKSRGGSLKVSHPCFVSQHIRSTSIQAQQHAAVQAPAPLQNALTAL